MRIAIYISPLNSFFTSEIQEKNCVDRISKSTFKDFEVDIFEDVGNSKDSLMKLIENLENYAAIFTFSFSGFHSKRSKIDKTLNKFFLKKLHVESILEGRFIKGTMTQDMLNNIVLNSSTTLNRILSDVIV